MYDFVDVNERAVKVNKLFTVFNGVELDSVLPFTTGQVNGRNVVSQKHITNDVPGRDGGYFISKKLETREIVVKGVLKAKSNKDLRSQFEKLNVYLLTERPAELKFSDEADRTYYAQFSSLKVADEISNIMILELTFICYDPYKYGPIQTSTANRVDVVTDFPVFPKVTLRLNSNTNEIRLLHVEDQKYIRLSGSYTAGNTIVIDFEKRTITLNGRNDLHKFDMVNSRFFKLNKGINTLNLNVEGTITTEWRCKYL